VQGIHSDLGSALLGRTAHAKKFKWLIEVECDQKTRLKILHLLRSGQQGRFKSELPQPLAKRFSESNVASRLAVVIWPDLNTDFDSETIGCHPLTPLVCFCKCIRICIPH
jgi:hypothetical protein